MRDAIIKRKIKRNKKRNSTDAIIIKNIKNNFCVLLEAHLWFKLPLKPTCKQAYR